MATSEIEKLERRYAENPHGLTFAPLAEVHRKNGDIARALELLTAGLELHPNYIPASIVLGRCHQDAGDLPAAEAAFAHVLRLDDENVIALKSLADINERLERYDLAANWLRQLVQVDRNNDEAREQLERIEAARDTGVATTGQKESAERKSAEEEPAEPELLHSKTTLEEPASPPVLEMIDLPPEPVAPAEGPVDPAPDPLPVDIAALELSTADAAAGGESPSVLQERDTGDTAAAADVVSVAPAAPAAPEATEETVQPLPGLISAEFQPPLQATGGLDVETSEEVVLEGSGNSEFRVPDASEDLKFLAARLAEPQPRPVVEPVETREVGAEIREPAPKAPAEPEFVVTETMADVLLQQGLTEEALRVYRELVRRSGGDARLEARISELESAASQAPQKRRSYLARETNGQSVASFFQALLSARPPSEPVTGPDMGSPGGAALPASGPNGGPLSGLSNESGAAPPAVPSGEPNADPAVSFDDFFSAETGGSPSMRQGKSDPGGDDLDQFQSWLENLKR